MRDLAPRVGLEPTAYGLTVRRSTIELPGSKSRREESLARRLTAREPPPSGSESPLGLRRASPESWAEGWGPACTDLVVR